MLIKQLLNSGAVIILTLHVSAVLLMYCNIKLLLKLIFVECVRMCYYIFLSD